MSKRNENLTSAIVIDKVTTNFSFSFYFFAFVPYKLKTRIEYIFVFCKKQHTTKLKNHWSVIEMKISNTRTQQNNNREDETNSHTKKNKILLHRNETREKKPKPAYIFTQWHWRVCCELVGWCYEHWSRSRQDVENRFLNIYIHIHTHTISFFYVNKIFCVVNKREIERIAIERWMNG